MLNNICVVLRINIVNMNDFKKDIILSAVKAHKALIVEDDLDICYLVSGILKQKNLDYNYVNSLSDAVKYLSNNTTDILILDNHLPDGLGVDFISYIKKNYPEIHIIMITAHDTQPDRINALDKGADFFLGKPFTRAAMNATLDNFIH